MQFWESVNLEEVNIFLKCDISLETIYVLITYNVLKE